MNKNQVLVFQRLTNEDGIITYEGYTFNGKACGKGKAYWENGNIYQEGEFDVKGLIEGTEYYSTGVPRFKGKYQINKEYGPNIPIKGEFYSESGEPVYKGDFELDMSNNWSPRVIKPEGFGNIEQWKAPDFLKLHPEEKRMKNRLIKEIRDREAYVKKYDLLKDRDRNEWQKLSFELYKIEITIQYKRTRGMLYDFHMIADLSDRTMVNDLHNRTVCFAVSEVSQILHEEVRFLMLETDFYKVMYEAAIKHGDPVFTALLKHGFRKTDAEDTKLIERVIGEKLLPRLPERFDNYYTVNADSIDHDLLERSGYIIWHRPDFAMKGRTREKCTLDPFRLEGDDAAYEKEDAIDFKEFLSLFDESEGI